MKIFIEAHTILKNRSGVGWFAHELTRGMQAHLKPNDTINLLTHPQEKMDIDSLLRNSQTYDRPIDWMPSRLYHALKFRNSMPPVDLFYGNGVYIFPNFLRWPLARAASVIVVHDLSMFDFPDYTSPSNLELMTKQLPPSIARADLIVSVSQSTKEFLCERFNVDPKKVIVAHLAAEPSFYYHRSADEVAEVKAKYGLFGKYFLFLSTLEPRKNVEGLIAAYRALPKKVRDEVSLVLVGGNGWRDTGIQDAIRTARMAGERIIRPGYVDEVDKPALFSGAEAFVLPSHYEGFGLPVLEAMACGTPVLTSNNSSLPEVAGNAAIMVDSTDHQAIVDGMNQLVIDKTLRDDLIMKGYKQAALFSWEKCAGQVLKGINDHHLV